MMMITMMSLSSLRQGRVCVSVSPAAVRRCCCSGPVNSEPLQYRGFGFEVLAQSSDSAARRATITTPHGEIQTPAFVFCATKAALKGGLTPDMLRSEDTSVILSNTYHLLLQPGADVVQDLGGLHRMTGWNGPMLTDSGGYQIFSMGHGSVSNEVKGRRNSQGGSAKSTKTLIKVDEEGATFRSYIDGRIHSLTPENSIQVQQKLGADLIVVLDECTPFHVSKSYTAASMRRSHRWALRSLLEFRRGHTLKPQALYGIIQGGIYEDLRRESAEFVNKYPFFGTAIGGSLGSDKKSMYNVVSITRRLVRGDRPVHLLGIGGIRDIFHGVRLGIDTFDCVHPTRLGRHGGALVTAAHWDRVFEEVAAEDLRDHSSCHNDSTEGITDVCKKKMTHKERKAENWKRKLAKQLEIQRQNALIVREHLNIVKPNMLGDTRPIDSDCLCYTCKNFSRGYLHHLFKSKETLGQVLLTIHNVHFMNKLMSDIRQGIVSDTLDDVERKYIHPKLVGSSML